VTNLKARFKTTSAAASRNRVVEYRSGQYIFRRGDLGAEMYVIHDGRIEVLGPGDQGLEEKVVAALEKGDFFGEMAVLEGLPRSASVRAATDVKLVRIDGATFTQLLRSEPEVAVRIMRKLSRRLRAVEAEKRESRSGLTEKNQAEVAASVESAVTASLIHCDSGTKFEVTGDVPVLVGRRDPITGIEPQVDLTAIDPERSCSRQHAKIVREGQDFLLIEDIGTTNGTFLNGMRLATGVPGEIRHGDKLRFGTVSLTFEI